MNHVRPGRLATIVVAIALAVVLLSMMTACGKKSSTTATGDTAQGGIPAARSALSTMAPDAKLLLVQLAEPVTTTSTPVWAYLFGSPANDKTFVVYVNKGSAMPATEYGTAGLSADEWKTVPSDDTWKIDSDAAYDKALKASGAKGDPAAYFMGLQTYVPESIAASSTVKPYVWYVSFDPGSSGATTSTIEVNAKTGATTVAKPE